jgi:hypothetical protein
MQGLLFKGKVFVRLLRQWEWLTLQCTVCSEGHFATRNHPVQVLGLPLMMKALVLVSFICITLKDICICSLPLMKKAISRY